MVRPSSKLSSPSESTRSSATVPTHTRRGRALTRSATRLQRPCVASAPSSPKWGMNGQNARRPKITSSAGSRVSIETIATPMPIAPIGPRPAVPFSSASVRHSSAAITVMPDARIAGPAVFMASSIASWRSSCLRSSSR